MPEGGEGGSGIKGFLSKDTAGLPNWAWLLVIAAGIGAAYIVPKFLAGKGTNATDQGSTNTGTDQSGTNGIGLAIDPTTGLPYAVEGLSPSGGLAGSGGAGGIDLSATNTLLQQILANLTKTTPLPTPKPKPKHKPDVDKNVKQKTPPKLPTPAERGGQHEPLPASITGTRRVRGDMIPMRHSTVPQWPYGAQSLGDIARLHGVSERRLQLLNPHLEQPHNLQPGQKVRIA